jgi:ubiquinone/menaquinone biosynthesis C-methylase UbiE
MISNKNFNQESYKSHEGHYDDHIHGGQKEAHSKTWFETDTVDAWRHARMYNSLDPLLRAYPKASWLTVGDGRYGKDAHYIQEKGLKVLASDISEALLKEGKEIGYIEDYRKENVEALTFPNEEFDFVFCKESYHHFPRPMIALYEMLRVAKKAVVLIEPNDEYVYSTVLEILFRNIKNLIKYILHKKIVNHSFEEVGNYVYSISRREVEKVALGMNYKVLAFKGINDYYKEGVEYEKATNNSKLFRQLKRRICFFDLLTKFRLKKYTTLTVVIFKEESKLIPMDDLVKEGYEVVVLPNNPYLQQLPDGPVTS